MRARGAGGGPARPALRAAPALAVVALAAIAPGGLFNLVAPFLVSFAAITPFLFVLRPRIVPFVIGATAIAVIAAVLELGAGDMAGSLTGPVLVVLLVAPVTEELLKFSVSVWRGATYRTAAGAALGFAATENGLYFLAAWNGPLETLVALVVVRSITDPLLHTGATTLTTSSWRGSSFGLPAGILLHVGWNALSLVAAQLPPALALTILGVAAIGLVVVLYLEHHHPSTRSALSGRISFLPWSTGVRA